MVPAAHLGVELLLAFLHLAGGLADRLLQAREAVAAFAVALVELRADVGQFLALLGQFLPLTRHGIELLGQFPFALVVASGRRRGLGEGRALSLQLLAFLGDLLLVALLLVLEADDLFAELLELLL